MKSAVLIKIQTMKSLVPAVKGCYEPKLLVVKSLTFLLLMILTSANMQAQYISGDTSVCPGATETYTFVGAGITFSLSGGGTITGTTTNSVTIAWGSVPGTFTINYNNGSPRTQRVFVEGNSALSCDDLVNVSLDGNCQALITPATILEGEPYPLSSYTVTVFNTNNVPVPGNIVNNTHLGKILKVLARHDCSGNTCWGNILIEDKFIPDMICNNRDTINCGQSIAPSALGFPLPAGVTILPHPNRRPNYFIVKNFDLCGDVELSYFDIAEKGGCNGRFYETYKRTWTAVDIKGNTKMCMDSIFVRKGSIDSLVCPRNYDGFDLPFLLCHEKEPSTGPFPRGWNALPNGHPSPYDSVNPRGQIIHYGTGFPGNVSCDHFAVSFRDIRIPICGNTFKLLRSWTIFDWCNGRVEECMQLIKVVDDRPPLVICPLNGMVVPTNNYNCTGSVLLPIPTTDPRLIGVRPYVDDCSPFTYTVAHLQASHPDSCQPGPGTPSTLNVTAINTPNGVQYRVDNMPLGCNWIYYTITDLCGNVSTCVFDVEVIDDLDPVAVCDEHTVVTINEQGVGLLFATSVDNGSFDNCEIDSMRIRRMSSNCGIDSDTLFKPSVTFCCEDLPYNPIMVVFRVWDKEGNFNDCMVSVTVQDKIAPKITCPPDRRNVACGTDINDLSILGRATATDGCDSVKITYNDIVFPGRCGLDSIVRRWTATDLGGRFDICNQIIVIKDNVAITRNDLFRNLNLDLTVNGCRISDADPSITGRPNLPNHPCKNLIAGYNDETFYNVDGFCIKIIRHWKVIDWCLYDVNAPRPQGLYEVDQVIKVRGTSRPEFRGNTCTPVEACSENRTCDAFVSVIGSATDDCTDSADLVWTYTILYNTDRNANGTSSVSGSGKNASGNYPIGTHTVRWTVTNRCGNSSTCNKTIRVRDCKAPTPFCKSGIITVIMQMTGDVTIWAKDFDEKSEDNCTPNARLKFSFTSNVADSFRTYRCADIPDGRSVELPVRIYVTDEAGNQQFCDTRIILQDNLGNVCPNTSNFGGEISGVINTSNNSNLQNSNLELYKYQVNYGSVFSDRDGKFSFNDLPEGEDYMVKPIKDDDVLNGITTADIVLIQKHILGVRIFTSPYEYIAADVNNSKSITASDMSDLRKLILGVEARFKNGQKSWRFIQEDHNFVNPLRPWEGPVWPEELYVTNLKGKLYNRNFVAVKIGDLNYTALTREVGNVVKARASGTLTLEIDETKLLKGQAISIPVYGHWNNKLSGFQMAWKFDTDAIQVKGVQSGAIVIGHANIGLGEIDKGIMRMSWNAEADLTMPHSPLFYIDIVAKQDVRLEDVVRMSEAHMDAEAYTSDLDLLDVELRTRRSNVSLANYELFQNEPNPFGNLTTIKFLTPSAEEVVLSIFDLSGKKIWSRQLTAQKGKNAVTIEKAELSGHSGVLFYSLATPTYHATRKMILH